MERNFKKIVIMFALLIGFSVFASAQTKTEIKASDLQKSITDNIANNYVGYTINKAYKVVTKTNSVQYNVNIVNGEKVFRLIYDNNGKLIKAVEAKNKNNKKKASN